MAQILSQNEKSVNNLKNFFVPSLAAWIVFFLSSTVLILAYNFGEIINWLGNDYLQSAENQDLSIRVLSNGLTNSFDSALGGRLGQIIVWSLVGALTYILIWFVKNMFNSVENDIIVDHYLHPHDYNRKKYFGSAGAVTVFFIAVLVVLTVYTFAGLKIIVPAAASLTSSSISHFHLLTSIMYIALSVLIPAVVIYIWTLLAKALVYLWRLI